MRLLLGLVMCAAASGVALAAPLQPLKSTAAGIPLAQLLGAADTLGEWTQGRADVKLVQVLSREGGECRASEEYQSNTCPRYKLFVVMDVELADPTAFTVYELPETLGWTLPKTFKPDETSDATTVPLIACEMKRTSAGFGWRTVSYRLRVSHKVSSIIGEPPFQFAASLVKLPGERDDCPP